MINPYFQKFCHWEKKKKKSSFNLKFLLFCRIKDKQTVPGINALMNARVWSYSMHRNAAQDLLHAPFFSNISRLWCLIVLHAPAAKHNLQDFLISEILFVLQRPGILQFSPLIKQKAEHCWKKQQEREIGSKDQNAAAGKKVKTAQRTRWLTVLKKRRKESSDNLLQMSNQCILASLSTAFVHFFLFMVVRVFFNVPRCERMVFAIWASLALTPFLFLFLAPLSECIFGYWRELSKKNNYFVIVLLMIYKSIQGL